MSSRKRESEDTMTALTKIAPTPVADASPKGKKPRKMPLPVSGTTAPKALALDTFLSLTGQKVDQLAGFRAYARNQKMGPMPMGQWREELEKFWARPVR